MAQCKQFTCSVTSHPKGNSPSDYRHCVPLVNFLSDHSSRLARENTDPSSVDCPACTSAQCYSTLYNKRFMEHIFFVIQLRKAP